MSILGTALQLRAKCSGEKHLVALFLFCCTRTFFLSVSEGVRGAWLMVMSASAPGWVEAAPALLAVRTSPVQLQLCGAHRGVACPVEAERAELLTALLSSFTGPKSRRGAALLPVLLPLCCPLNC